MYKHPSGAEKRKKKDIKDKQSQQQKNAIIKFLKKPSPLNALPSNKTLILQQEQCVENNFVDNSYTTQTNECIENETNTNSPDINNNSSSSIIYSDDIALWTDITHGSQEYYLAKPPCSIGELEASKKLFYEGKNLRYRQINQNIFIRKLHNGESVKRNWLIYSATSGKIYC